MNHYILRNIFLTGILLVAYSIHAQDPVDCVGAIPVCDSQQLNYNSNGPGNDDFGPGPNDPAGGCLINGEHQSAWFEIYISPSSPPDATLAFTITPTGGFGEDYDFALYGPNVDCSDLGLPIRCSYANENCGFCPETGLGMGTTDFTEGFAGDGFVAEVLTQPGESYILLVDNWQESNEGFFLDWTGTAVLSCSCTTIPEITGELEICPDESTILTASGTDLTDFAWAASDGGGISGPTDEASVNALSTGTYTVTVTDAEGCTGTSSVEIIAAPGPQIEVDMEPAQCGQNNGSIDISVTGGSGPFTFAWSNGETVEDLIDLSSGTFTVTVTSADGCTASASVDVPDESTPIDVTGIPEANTSCISGNGSIMTTVSPPGNYTYQWSNGETTQDLTDLSPGTYTVTVTSAGDCSGTASFLVEDLPDPPSVEAQITPALCGLANGSIDVTVSGGTPPYSYVWSSGEMIEDPEGLAAGLYILTVTDDNGCSTEHDINLTDVEPEFLISATILPNTNCGIPNGSLVTTIDPPVSPTGEPYVYAWSNGFSDPNLSDLAGGTYTVTVSAGGSCTATATFSVPDQPAIPVINPDVIPANCGQNNGSIQLTVSGSTPPYSYLWDTGTTDSILSDLSAGAYSVTVTGDNGCSAMMTVTVPDEPLVFTVDAVIEPNTSCSGNGDGSISVTVLPGGNYTYLWNTGQSTNAITDLLPGSYLITVSAGGTCEQVLTFNVTDVPALPEFDSDITPAQCGESDGSATLIPTGGAEPFTYLWSNGQSGQSLLNQMSGNYTVTVTGLNACVTTATVIIPDAQIDIEITEDILANTSCINGNGAIDLSVSPASGLTFLWSNGAITEDIENLNSGVYMLTVSAGGTCEEEFVFTVPEQSAVPLIHLATTNATCGQANGGVDLSMETGEAPFTYQWSTGMATEDLDGVPPGSYSVTATDALGCTNSAAVTVANQIIDIEISGYAEPNTSCSVPNGEVNITIAPPGLYQYAWSNGETFEDMNSLEPGSYEVTVTFGDMCFAVASFVVEDNTSVPVVSAEITPAICGDDNGAVDLTVAGSEEPYAFLWSHGETFQDVTDLFPGSYWVTVTGANDCEAILSVDVPNSSSDFSISGTTTALTNCVQNNGEVNILVDPPGSYTFVWSNGASTEDITGLPAGAYTVTVTLAGSCDASMTFIVNDETQSPSYLATVVPDFCSLGIGSVTLTEMTGEPPFIVLWSNGDSSVTADSLNAGTYTVTATDNNGCTASSTHVVSSNSQDIAITGLALPNTSCADPDGSIDIAVSPTQAYTYLWSNGAVTEDISGLTSGTYIVTVSTGTCSSVASFVVGSGTGTVSLNGSVTEVICNGGNDGAIDLDVSGGIAPYVFEWNPFVAGAPEDPGGLPAGIYQVTVTDQSGCSATSSFAVGEPEVLILSCTQLSNVSAPGASDGTAGIVITGGTSPYTVTWQPGGMQSDVEAGLFEISNLSEGTYDIEVLDAHGCLALCSLTMTADNCTTVAGVTDPVPVEMCGPDCIMVGYDPSTEVLNSGDIVQFVLHSGPADQIQNIISRNIEPEFCFDTGLMEFNTQYYISAVAGPDDGSGNVLLTAACTYTAIGTPVIFYESPQASIDIPDQIDCDHPSVILTGHSSISPSTYHWSSKVGSILSDPNARDIEVNAGGYYELVVSAHACRDTTGVDVIQSDDYPVLTIDSAGILNCRDTIVLLSGSTTHPDVELFWATIENGDTTILGSGGAVTVSQPGTYYFIGIAANGCANAKAIPVSASINEPDVHAGDDVFLNCNVTSVEITADASAGVAFEWKAPAGVQLTTNDIPTIPVDQPGVYVVTVIDTVTFCTAGDSIEVFVNQNAPVSQVIADPVTCAGDSDGAIYVFPEQGEGPFTFYIDGLDHGDDGVFSSLEPGNYLIEVIDASGCKWSEEVSIAEPDMVHADLGADLTVYAGNQIHLSVQTNVPARELDRIEWVNAGDRICIDTLCTRIRLTPQLSGIVSVIVTDMNGCTASDAISITVISDQEIFIPNVFSPNNDGVNDILTVFAGSGVRMIHDFHIYSRWGESVFEMKELIPNSLSEGWDGTYRGEPVNPGVFVWKGEVEYESGRRKAIYGSVTLVQ